MLKHLKVTTFTYVYLYLKFLILQGSVLYNWFSKGKLERSEGTSITEGNPQTVIPVLCKGVYGNTEPIVKYFPIFTLVYTL